MKKILFIRAFTLIEVMVVVVIISILATAGFASFSGARTEAKNKSFATELKEAQLAIELYRAQKGNYPPVQTGCFVTVSGVNISNSTSCGSAPIILGLTPEFIAELPDVADSANSSCELIYQVEATSGTWYKLTADNCFGGADSAAEGVQRGNPLARCASTCTAGDCITTSAAFYNSYAIYSDGGQCR